MPKLVRITPSPAAIDERYSDYSAGIVAVESAGAPGILVSWVEWRARRAELIDCGRPLGVRVEPADSVEDLAPDLQHLALVAVNFPVFTDGRGFSSARLLRQRYGFTGEVRAVGDVLRDQVFFFARCGFDTVALRDDQDIDAALGALHDFREVYQTGVDQPLPLFRRRRAALARIESAPEIA